MKGSEYLTGTQSSYLYNERGNLYTIDTIYKFENISACINNLNLITGKSGYLHLNKSTYDKSPDQYYTPELKEIVYNKYEEDFLNFNYEK